MAALIQIILINLAVSCDNVGVIALATRDLPERHARLARISGIGLSILLKLVFLAFAGMLLSVPWLHIRIAGGTLLLYVTFNMVRHGDSVGAHSEHRSRNDSFLNALIAILAADISMSLDNVLAVLSIISKDGNPPDSSDLLMVAVSLLLCVPILLWFSGTVSRLMEHHPAITCLCAGYLVYIAFHMMFQDPSLVFFFERINFTLAAPAAVLFGGMAALACLIRSGRAVPGGRVENTILLLCFAICLHTLISLAGISWLSTAPLRDGIPLSTELIYGFSPVGVNAVYTIGEEFTLFAICSTVQAGMLLSQKTYASAGEYRDMLSRLLAGMVLFVGVELLVSGIGLTLTFGFGSFLFPEHLWALLLQLATLFAYVCFFCMIAALVRNRFLCIALGMLYIFIHHALAELFLYLDDLSLCAAFLPGYYVFALPHNISDPHFVLRALLLSALWIILSTWIGYACHCRRVRRRFRPAASLPL